MSNVTIFTNELVAMLQSFGVDKIKVAASGGGDSGSIDCIQFIDAEERSVDFKGAIDSQVLASFLHKFFDDFISKNVGLNWYDQEGGYVSVTAKLKDGSMLCDIVAAQYGEEDVEKKYTYSLNNSFQHKLEHIFNGTNESLTLFSDTMEYEHGHNFQGVNIGLFREKVKGSLLEHYLALDMQEDEADKKSDYVSGLLVNFMEGDNLESISSDWGDYDYDAYMIFRLNEEEIEVEMTYYKTIEQNSEHNKIAIRFDDKFVSLDVNGAFEEERDIINIVKSEENKARIKRTKINAGFTHDRINEENILLMHSSEQFMDLTSELDYIYDDIDDKCGEYLLTDKNELNPMVMSLAQDGYVKFHVEFLNDLLGVEKKDHQPSVLTFPEPSTQIRNINLANEIFSLTQSFEGGDDIYIRGKIGDISVLGEDNVTIDCIRDLVQINCHIKTIFKSSSRDKGGELYNAIKRELRADKRYQYEESAANIDKMQFILEECKGFLSGIDVLESRFKEMVESILTHDTQPVENDSSISNVI